MADRMHRLALRLAAAQIVDAVANAIPKQYVERHLDHLGVPDWLRPAFPVIKVGSSMGLLVGLKVPAIGVVTSAALVSYYTAAARFHLEAGDHPVLATPAAGFGAAAAVLLCRLYLPAARPRR